MNRSFREAMIGSVQAVLFEETASGDGETDPSTPRRSAQDDAPAGPRIACPLPPGQELWTGHAPSSIRVYAPGKELHNRVLPVKITGLYEDGVLGEIAPDEA